MKCNDSRPKCGLDIFNMVFFIKLLFTMSLEEVQIAKIHSKNATE